MKQGNKKGIYKNKLSNKILHNPTNFLSLIILDSLWQGVYKHNRSYKSFFNKKFPKIIEYVTKLDRKLNLICYFLIFVL